MFSSFVGLIKFCSFFWGLGIGIKALLLPFMGYIYFLERYGVLITRYLLFLSSSCELFLFVIEGSLTLGIFYWLKLLILTFDFLKRVLLFSEGLKILLLLSPNYLFSLLESFFKESLSLFIIFGGRGTKLTHLCSVSGKTIVSSIDSA